MINVWTSSYGVDYDATDIYARGHQIPDRDTKWRRAKHKLVGIPKFLTGKKLF